MTDYGFCWKSAKSVSFAGKITAVVLRGNKNTKEV